MIIKYLLHLNMSDCEMTRHMPTGAFVVFVGALLIFSYVLFDDYQKTNNERSTEENVWITIFFVLLIACVVISGLCVVRINKKINNSEFGKKINKNLNILREKFNSTIPNFVGKKRIK
jgi:hypothetical protein